MPFLYQIMKYGVLKGVSRCTRTRTNIRSGQAARLTPCADVIFLIIKEKAGDGNLRLRRKVLAALEREPTSAANKIDLPDFACGCGSFTSYKREGRATGICADGARFSLHSNANRHPQQVR